MFHFLTYLRFSLINAKCMTRIVCDVGRSCGTLCMVRLIFVSMGKKILFAKRKVMCDANALILKGS